MTTLSGRIGVIAALLVSAAVLMYGLEAAAGAGGKTVSELESIPGRIGGWYGEDVAVERSTKDILETDAVLMREYCNGDARVLLAIVYYRDSRVALHLPESCYTGQGSHIVDRAEEQLQGFRANRLTLEGNKGNQSILYYFETGDLRTPNYGEMRFAMLRNRLTGRDRGCALVRYSIDAGADGPDGKSLELLKSFVAQADDAIAGVVR